MANRSRGRSRAVFVRPAPKTKIWISSGLAEQALASGAATLLSSLNAAALALRPFTILRTRLEIMWRSDQSAASETPTGAIGIIVVKETASTIGVTAVPSPLAEPDADFFVYQGVTTSILSLSSIGVLERGNRYVIDSRAMRKVGVQDDIIGVGETRSTGGAQFNQEGRILIQLH